MNFIKKAVKPLIVGIMCLNLTLPVSAETLFETYYNEAITSGVTYEKIQQVTDSGLLDIFITRINLTDEYVSIKPVESKTEYGLKEPAAKILADNFAVAGVNGDFFGMKGKYSATLGPVFRDNMLISLNSLVNENQNDFASFYLTKDNIPFITYLSSKIDFLVDGKNPVGIYAINKITDMVMPICINRKAFTDTAFIDSAFPNLGKVVIENDAISYVSKKGELVKVPENGYVIVMNEKTTDGFTGFFRPGQKAQLKVVSGVDFNNIKSAIGGGAKILQEGKIVSDSKEIINGKHPRTAIGITKDKKQVILMAVDGRTHSIGVSHQELGELLLKHGAYDAIHLDGGGSTTMAIKSAQTNYFKVVNTPSDGAERKVVNALGVFDTAPIGEIEKLIVKPTTSTVFKDVPVKVEVYGIDKYNHRISIDSKEVVISSNDPNGVFNGDIFIPAKLGETKIIASYKNLAGQAIVTTKKLTEIVPSQNIIKLSEGAESKLSFTGIDNDGNSFPLQAGVWYQVAPANIGHVDNSSFYADEFGKGYIKCTAADISTYIEVYVGGKNVMLSSFEKTEEPIKFVGYPQVVTGSVEYNNHTYTEGSKAIDLKYHFPVNDTTNAAYLEFEKPFEIEGTPIALKLSVFGDKSDKWLRARLIDDEGNTFVADVAKNIDWEGWKQLTISLPADVKYPIKLSRLYVASLENLEESKGHIVFDKLIGVYNVEQSKVTLPEASKFTDPLRVDLPYDKKQGIYDITILGKMSLEDNKPKTYNETQNRVLESFKRGAKLGIYLGETDLPTSGIPIYVWNGSYTLHQQDSVALFQMSAAKNGSFLDTNKEQWKNFVSDAERSEKQHIIVVMDKNLAPLMKKKEIEMFQDELVKFKKAGKNVFVVSTEGQDTTTRIIDGIRYINLGPLFNEDGTLNKDFRVLRFRIDSKKIQYDFNKDFY